MIGRLAPRRAFAFLAVALCVALAAGGCGAGGESTLASGAASKAGAGSKGAGSPAPTESDVSFTSGADTVYGTLELPPTFGEKVPAALIIAGSGPTDRNGNSALLPGPVDTLRDFAAALASAGIASLRYDKLGTGETGLASHALHPGDIGFDTYENEALAAYDYLRSRPEVDPGRVLVLGHSEGGLFALTIATQRQGADAPRALVLASSLGFPYLATIRRQLGEQYDAAVKAGSISQAAADTALADLDRMIASLGATGAYPGGFSPPEAALKAIFTAGNERFLGQVAGVDPAQLASRLPSTLQVLILQGDKDSEIGIADAQNLLRAFRDGGNANARLVELADVDHVYKEVSGIHDPAADFVNPNLPFSRQASDQLRAFAAAVLR